MTEPTRASGQRVFNDPISVAKRTTQSIYPVEQRDKAALLRYILEKEACTHTVVVTQTKRDADTLSRELQAEGFKAAALHGNKSKQMCEESAKAFNEGELSILVTTDMILQALPLERVESMISYALPNEAEHYLGRLRLLQERGEAIAFVSPQEEGLLYTIERLLKAELPREAAEGFEPSADLPEASRPKVPKKKPRHRKERRKSSSAPKEA